MGVGAGLYMCDLVKKFTFAISSPDEFLSYYVSVTKTEEFGEINTLLTVNKVLSSN